MGRNLIQVPIRELYKPKPDCEILHAHQFVVDPENITEQIRSEEHIASKTERYIFAMLDLEDALLELGAAAGLADLPDALLGVSRDEIRANGWMHYPQILQLSRVCPLDMSEREFTARCKQLHEFWETIPNGFFRRLLIKAGVPKASAKPLGSLKLFQGVINIVEHLNSEAEGVSHYGQTREPESWDCKNQMLAPLFVTHDLRLADAHQLSDDITQRLGEIGIDTAELVSGHGRALDCTMDALIETYEGAASSIVELLERG